MKVSDKSNEITAIPALLELLDTTGSIITIDAMGTQTEIAKKIIDKKANYVLALKANHPTLYHSVVNGKAILLKLRVIKFLLQNELISFNNSQKLLRVCSIACASVLKGYFTRCKIPDVIWSAY
jgi:predicted transposase YbfD/YdcC